MHTFIRFCKGIVVLQISGYAPELFLNLCKTNDIILYNIAVKGSVFEFEIKTADFFKLKKIARKTGVKIHIITKQGLPFLLFRYRKHNFFGVGIIAALMFLFYMSQMIWDISFNGNQTITDIQLTEYLKEKGIFSGTPLSKIDCNKLEEEIRNDYPEIAWISVSFDGTRLVINMHESKVQLENAAESKTGQDMVATNPGTVISIVVDAGTPLVKSGDSVSQGDVLISGCLELFDDYDNIVGYEYCSAKGTVLIESEIPYTDTIQRSVVDYKKTEKKHFSIKILLKDNIISIGRNHKFDKYQIITEEKKVRIGNIISLPIKIILVKTEELSQTERLLTETELEKTAAERFLLYCKKMDKKGFQLIDKNVKINVNDTQAIVSGYGTFQYVEKELKDTKTRSLELEEGTNTEWD